MNINLWQYQARLVRVIDGDTYYLEIDKGMYDRSIESIRLAGIDTPEIFRGTEAEKERGQAAKAFAEEWFAALDPHEQWPIIIETLKDTRSFDRYVAHVTDREGNDLREALTAAGHLK